MHDVSCFIDVLHRPFIECIVGRSFKIIEVELTVNF